jgi:hypothetical protein
MVTCTFTNTRRGTAIVVTESVPEDAAGSFQFTGVPSGTVPGRGTLVAADLTPGTYTTTEIDPSPEFELTAVECDDSNSQSASSGDAQTRTAVYNLDPGETIICRFVNEAPTSVITPTLESGSSLAGSDSDNESLGKDPTETGVGTNPFENPSQLLENFPLPSELPPGAGTYDIPKAGPWSVTNFAGQMSCGEFGLSIPAGPREDGILEVLDDGQKLVGTGLQDAEGVSITLNADPKINGRYSGTAQGVEQGVPVAISYFWQVITDEYIIGYLTAEVSAQGISCNVYRAFEMIYTG